MDIHQRRMPIYRLAACQDHRGKLIIRGGSGNVDPDGTLHSVGAAGGMTLTAVGRLSGNTGAGTFDPSDGCVGRWIAIKH
jgi:hypothetical protein